MKEILAEYKGKERIKDHKLNLNKETTSTSKSQDAHKKKVDSIYNDSSMSKLKPNTFYQDLEKYYHL